MQQTIVLQCVCRACVCGCLSERASLHGMMAVPTNTSYMEITCNITYQSNFKYVLAVQCSMTMLFTQINRYTRLVNEREPLIHDELW